MGTINILGEKSKRESAQYGGENNRKKEKEVKYYKCVKIGQRFCKEIMENECTSSNLKGQNAGEYRYRANILNVEKQVNFYITSKGFGFWEDMEEKKKNK